MQILEENLNSSEQLNDREIFWIKEKDSFYLNNPLGYNMTQGGAGFRKQQKINQYSLSGIFIKQWNDMYEICNFFKCPQRNLFAALTKEYSQYKGFLWKYEKDESPIQEKIDFYKNKQKRKGGGYQIICKETGEVFSSYRELERKIGANRKLIAKQIKSNNYFIYQNKTYEEKAMNYFEMGIQKYWAPNSTLSPEKKRQMLELMASNGEYIFSEKFDGNFSRGVITPTRNALQTRGISKKTRNYGEIQNKVFFWSNVCKAFNKGDTVILGEVYIPGGIDSTVGSILRSADNKAISRQKETGKKVEWRIFDVLALDGISFLNKPIEERIKYIPEVVYRINDPLVKGVEYQEMKKDFFDQLNKIFSHGGEGCVCYKKGVLYSPGKRTKAWDTCKVKQEITSDIDCFILSAEKGERIYNGIELTSWPYWYNIKTNEKLFGEHFIEYRDGIQTIEPISKNEFFNWPSSIKVGVYDKNGKVIPLCSVSGLTEELKTELRDNFKDWYHCPLTIGGMMISDAKADENGIGISIRHPYIKKIRKEDIEESDCTLEKIIQAEA